MDAGFDIEKLRQEAQSRWLKPAEVLIILQNHGKYQITQKPPDKPPSGSLLLFNRRVLRFFRKDGHMWRKKKDGRTVGEAHERLKIGNVDALNCYYAHGEQNPYFQRRSYWMLDPAYEHIVLVHYLDVEGRNVSGSSMSTDSCSTINQISNNSINQGFTPGGHEACEPYQNSCSPGSVEEISSEFFLGNNKMDTKIEVNQALHNLKVQLSLDEDDLMFISQKLPPHSSQESQKGYEKVELAQDGHGLKYRPHGHYCDGYSENEDDSGSALLLKVPDNNQKKPFQLVDSKGKNSPSWNEMLEVNSSFTGIDAHKRASEKLPSDMLFSSGKENLSSYPLEQIEKSTQQQLGFVGNNANNWSNYGQLSGNNLQLHLSETRKFLLGPDDSTESPTTAEVLQEFEESTLCIPGASINEPNSGIGMLNKESGNGWIGSMEFAIDNNELPSHYSGMWFDQTQYKISPAEDSLTLADKQLFSIREIIPECAFVSESTKVIIIGDFLCVPSECSWEVMFGNIEVPLEIIQEGVLRCHAPRHVPGKVSLCITSGNREACSEVREFEYLMKPEISSSGRYPWQTDGIKSTEELLLLVRFVQTLLCQNDSTSVHREDTAEFETDPSRAPKGRNDQWQQIIEALLVDGANPSDITDWLLQELLKDKLQGWLSSKRQENDATGCSLSRQDQCIIHTLSGLGYEWALNPILNSGVGINFRDVRGWTALHWAAHFGREKMVAALLAAGASAGAVTDPTASDPVGKTPASIAAMSGHKGLAGYLSEVALTTHLSSLTMGESEISKASAAVEAERTVESISERNIQINASASEDQLSLQDSLAAVRNAALAAARIQSAFRAHSFRKRQQKTAESCDEYDLSLEEIHRLSTASRYQRVFHGARDQKFHKAALCIQKKFRGWRGRKNFLTLRQHVVKIQAHVRGHQVRKKYRLLWTVGIVEKAILRWRRRGVGLRGFKVESEPIDDIEEEDILKVFRKQKVDAALDEALSRVLSMVESPEARQQYSRVLESYRQAKAGLCSEDEATSNFCMVMENSDNDMYRPTLEEIWASLKTGDFGNL